MLDDLSPWTHVGVFAAAAIAVWLAGTHLARCTDRIAERTGLGREVLGVLLLGGVTALPEVAVAVSATLGGAPALSVNNILGSVCLNFVILAGADAFYGRRHALTSTPADPLLLLQGALGILLLAIVAAATVAGDVRVAGMGAWSWLLLAAFVGAVFVIAKSRRLCSWVPTHRSVPAPQRDDDNGDGKGGQSLQRLILQTVGVGAVILVAGYALATSGEALAELTGLGTSFFGAVALSMATSLPEISTVTAAVRLRRYEMALGDALGAIVFNLATLVVIDALHAGDPVLVEAGRFAGFAALLAIVLATVYLIGMIERRDRTVGRMGVDSWVVLGCYAAGIGVLYALR